MRQQQGLTCVVIPNYEKERQIDAIGCNDSDKLEQSLYAYALGVNVSSPGELEDDLKPLV